MKQLYVRCGAYVPVSEKDWKQISELTNGDRNCHGEAEKLLLKVIKKRGKIDLDASMYLPGRYLYLDNPNSCQFEFNKNKSR